MDEKYGIFYNDLFNKLGLRQMLRSSELESMTEEDLDELVHDYKSSEASWINNQGKEEQIEFILEFEGEI